MRCSLGCRWWAGTPGAGSRHAVAEPLIIAVLGAESTGKTRLAHALAEQLAERTGLRCTWVPEYLRQWCDEHARTPRRDEQAAIARRQTALIDAAASRHDVVVCDTTALMTAVYSHTVFGDTALDAMALQAQSRCSLTLVTALDLPWEADGLQRDGPQVREPVDDRLRALLAAAALPWSLVAGLGPARVQAALSACTPLLGPAAAAVADPGKGLFTRLSASTSSDAGWRIDCERCSDPGCEHLSLLAARSMRALS
ncbi:MAG: ATP-binding protein [Rubrivivax sp.]|nr:ATP-binding protein [Rubrivivax sp.]